MKKTIILAISFFAILSGKAQSALGISWVRYAALGNTNPSPLTPGKPQDITFYLANTGDHPVTVRGYTVSFYFYGSRENIIDKGWYVRIPPVTSANKLKFSQTVTMTDYPFVEDSIAMQMGKVEFRLVVRYYDDFQKENRVYTCIMSLKDHRSPQTLTDRVIYKEDKKEGK